MQNEWLRPEIWGSLSCLVGVLGVGLLAVGVRLSGGGKTEAKQEWVVPPASDVDPRDGFKNLKNVPTPKNFG